MKHHFPKLSFPSSRKLILSVLFAFLSVAVLTTWLTIHGVRAAEETAGEPASPAASSLSQDNPQSPDAIWQFVEESTIVQRGPRQIIPQVYRTVEINEEALRQRLATAPQEFTKEAKSTTVTLSLPLPDGTFGNFRIAESSIMEAPLAAQFPEIKTYTGQGIDDPAATVRFDLTPAGFHAMILSEWGTIFVDPYAKGDTANYITYFKGDYRNETKPFQCYFSEVNPPSPHLNTPQPHVVNGTILRTYRLALAATGEYTAFQGGTVAAALAAMTTTMNRVNGVYEKDLAVRMILIANEASIIYTNSASDPYTNNDGFAMLTQNQSNLDSVIGSANYDIGHVFSTGGGGVAGLGVVCSASFKGRGVTGSSSPTGDGFDIDYVAHEMGHQFGGNHTFNGTTSNCGGGNRAGNAAYEPGSGSTIMAYAGICGAQNLQLNSDDYFHVKSLEEMAAFIAGTACDVETSTGNTVPTVTVGASVTIPKSTPFTLTATGSDPNGDALTYCWEEYDLGLSSPPDTDADGNARPVLRSFNPTTNPSRTFPKLSNILNNTSSFGEVLPSISRTMNFQVTVRDNRAGGGGINTATKTVVVSAAAGPFLVTAPNTAVTWNAGTQQTVNWDAANTAASPVNAANVKISLSTDGGNTFPITLLASTPNDGSEVVTVPNNPTTTARLKIEAVGNVFFDLSNQNFTITSTGGCTYTIAPTSQTFSASAGSGSVNVTTQSGCNWTAVSNDAWLTVTAGASGTGNGTVNFNVAANASASQRTGTITIAGQTFTVTQSGSCSYSISPTSQSFTSAGGTGSTNVTTTAGCNWTAVSNDAWITIITGASGTGSGAVNFSVAANGSTSSRTGTMTIAGQTFTVTQSGTTPGCTYAISPTASNLYGSNAGTGSVSVTANAGCGWTAASNAGWLTITAGASGTGNGSVSYAVAANTSSVQRTGTLTIAGQTYTVTQVGAGCATLITPATASFSTSGGSLQIRLDAGLSCSWTITNLPGWVTVTTGTTGTGTKKITYTVAANTGAARHADLVISGQVHSIDQAGTGGPCTYAISPTSQSFIAAGGTGSTNVTTQPGCNWTAVSNAAWITITSGASGTGSGAVNFSVAANASSSSRTGTMTIAGQTFTVTQLGASPTCTYVVSPTSQSFTSAGGTGSANVTTTAGCNWTAVSNDAWITIITGASGTGSGAVNFSVAANGSTSTRTGTMTIAGQTFTVTQTGVTPTCSYSISPTGKNVSYGQISGSVSVTATAGCGWTAVSNVTWLTVNSGASGTGSGTVGYTVLANPNRTARTGTITIAGQTFTINQAARP